MGATHLLSSFRTPETGNIADIETDQEGGSFPLRTYGPYRSEYGRLCEFPNLPPLLVSFCVQQKTFFSFICTVPAFIIGSFHRPNSVYDGKHTVISRRYITHLLRFIVELLHIEDQFAVRYLVELSFGARWVP